MSRNESGAVLVLTTTANDESARTLSRALVEERLAACVTRSYVKSVYRWQSQADRESSNASSVCEEDEVLLVIKTSKACATRLEKRLLELHPYECPEVILLEPQRVGEKYLAWLMQSCD